MHPHERHERARHAREACEAHLNRLLAEHAQARRELESLARALTLLRARERALGRALEAQPCEEAHA